MNPVVVPTEFTARDKFSRNLARMSKSARNFAKEAALNFNNAGKTAFEFGKQSAIVTAMIAVPMVAMAKKAVEFEDKMSDIGKTTGLSGKNLSAFGDDILSMSLKTRSSIDDLSTIAEIGGRLGITGSKNLKAFTASANEFAVALGGDFSGGVESAITQFGKVSALFRDTKSLDVSEALKKSGSAMNSLSAKGVNVEGLTDFSLRVGALPEVFRPSLASTTALGAALQKSGVDAQIASSGFSNFITKAAQQLPAFAKEMGMSTQSAKDLMNTDTAKFFAVFSSKMKGVPANELAVKLKKLGLNSLEVQKAVGAMSGSMETYNELSAISAKQMKEGTSITEEYNTKNDNTAGQLAKLKNNVQALAITAGNALLPILNDLVSSVTPMLQSFAKWITQNKETVKTIAKVAVGVAAFAAGVTVLSYGIGVFQKAMVIARIATTLFNSALLANPIGLVVAGVLTLVTALVSAKNIYDRFTMAQHTTAEVGKRALERTVDQRVEMALLFNTLRRAKQGSEEYKTALQNIDAMSPGLVAKYNLQEKSLKNIAAAERQLAKEIMARAQEEVRAEMLKESVKRKMELAEGRDDSFLKKMLYWTGNAGIAQSLTVSEIQAENEIQGNLLSQMTDNKETPANPEKAKNDALLKNTLNVNFTGLPDGVGATVNGKQGNTSVTGMKKFATNN